MFVWTEQAEKDFRKKYPHRKNERKAGTPAMWDGREIKAGTILEGYQERGWVCETETKQKPKRKTSNNRRSRLSAKEKRQRWGKLMFYFGQHPSSLEEVASWLGFQSGITINKFVARHGEELAEKYGKLPFMPGLKKDFWNKVMEAAQ